VLPSHEMSEFRIAETAKFAELWPREHDTTTTSDRVIVASCRLVAPNGVRISGAEGVRCMRGLGRGRTEKRSLRACCLTAAGTTRCATVPPRLLLFSAKPWPVCGRVALRRRPVRRRHRCLRLPPA